MPASTRERRIKCRVHELQSCWTPLIVHSLCSNTTCLSTLQRRQTDFSRELCHIMGEKKSFVRTLELIHRWQFAKNLDQSLKFLIPGVDFTKSKDQSYLELGRVTHLDLGLATYCVLGLVLKLELVLTLVKNLCEIDPCKTKHKPFKRPWLWFGL